MKPRWIFITGLLLGACLGIAIAFVVVRSTLRLRGVLDALAMLPLAVPGLVIAFGYLGCFSGAFPNTLLDPRFNPMMLLAVDHWRRHR